MQFKAFIESMDRFAVDETERAAAVDGAVDTFNAIGSWATKWIERFRGERSTEPPLPDLS